ncbi:hypothetical protein [Parasediminibacterium sp. JCM 36343]|uniref:hypothetical protein n=1 Tax=Parasediminibacterium sp. JCM 36343 TaxID=3374279 RepID=UPI00397C79FA
MLFLNDKASASSTLVNLVGGAVAEPFINDGFHGAGGVISAIPSLYGDAAAGTNFEKK